MLRFACVHAYSNEFCYRLNDKDFVIYPGKVTQADCFRISRIGRLFPADTKVLPAAIEEVTTEMNLSLNSEPA